MAGFSLSKYVKKFCAVLVIMPIVALTGCGQGEGQVSIPGTAATPLPTLPPGFCDPINFEIFCESPEIINFNGGATEIVENPDPSGINENDEFDGVVLDKVARMRKFPDQVFGGTKLYVPNGPIDFSLGEFYKVKVWSSRPVVVTFKLEDEGNPAGGLAKDITHTGGGEWQELCFDFTGQNVPPPVLALTIIFDNGTQGGADIDPEKWTFYYDDITQTDNCGDFVADPGIVPDVTLYYPAGDSPDLQPGVDYDEVTGLESGSVINPSYADDNTYGEVLAVTSGIVDDTNIGQVGFIGFEPGFVTSYETLDFKAKGLPNFLLFVTLYEGSERLRINLSSSDFAEALDNGWYQVSIPVSSFTGLTTATGIAFETDDTSPMQFTFFMSDIGFGEIDDGGGDGPAQGGTVPDATILEADGSTADLTATFTGFDSGTGTAIIGTDSSYAQALEVTVANGYDVNLALAQLFITELSSLDSYDEFLFKVKGLTDNNLVLKIEPPAGGVAVAIDLTAPGAGITVEDLGDGWSQVVVALAQFGDLSGANVVILQTLDNAYAVGDTFLLTDIGFNIAGDGGNGGGTVLVTFDEAVPPSVTEFGGAGYAIEPGPAGGDGNALKIARDGGEVYAGAWVAIPSIPNDAGVQTLSALVYSPTAGVPIVTKVEFADNQGTGDVQANEAVVVGWQTLTWTYTNLAAPNDYNRFTILPNLGTVDTAKDYYFDNITLLDADGGGGGPVEGNLAVNGGFDDGFTGWAQYPSAQTTQTIVVDATTSSNVARLFIPASAGGVNNVLKQERLLDGEGVFSAGDTIQISFDYRGEPGEGILFVKSICETADPVCGDKLHNNGNPFLPAGWTNYTDTFTLGAGVTGYTLEFAAVCGGTGTCVADYFIDNVSITIQ